MEKSRARAMGNALSGLFIKECSVEIDREVPTDPIDRADYYRDSVVDDHVKEAMRIAAEIPVGIPGECAYCGEESARLVNTACAPCRDRYGL